MAAAKGRAVVVARAGTTVAGCRTKNLTINGSPIDVTTDDDAGVRQLLSAPGQIDVSISVSGILTSDQLMTEALSATGRTQTTTFTFQGGFVGSPDHMSFSGSFFLSSLKLGAEYQGAQTFDAEFQSAGAVTLA
jgi:TP901-1 family phage major tail protein